MTVSAASALNVAGTDTDARSYSTASWTPVPGRLYSAAIAVLDLGGSYTTITVSGNNISWTRIGNDVGGGLTEPVLNVYAGLATTFATAGALTFDTVVSAGQTADGAVWGIAEFTGAGAGGSDKGYVQNAIASTNADSITGTLGTFNNQSGFTNATAGWFLSYDNAGGALTNTAGAGFSIVTGLDAQQIAGGDRMRLSFEFRNDNDTTVTASASTNNDRMLMHAVEIRDGKTLTYPKIVVLSKN